MKQILQSLKDGRTEILDIPAPQVKAGHVVIKTTKSLISPGTEKMLIAFGQASWLNKIRQQPDKVRMVMQKVKTDGFLTTAAAVRDKLDQLIPMGYANVGKITALGAGVTEFAVGDRVVSNGAHAEIVSVAKNLCCKIPEAVSDDDAAFTVIGAIALQGLRLAHPKLGECFVVIGLGLIGLMTVQLLRAAGCRVLGIDVNPEKAAIAEHFGAEIVPVSDHVDAVQQANAFSRDRGVDGVIITCATTSNGPIEQAAKMCRKQGRIILVGVASLQLSRADFYEKELSFQVSCAYGPGRYDPLYEEHGQDYPISHVRFTAQRNFEAFLDMLSQQSVAVSPLISHRYPITKAEKAYELLTNEERVLGIILDYPDVVSDIRTINSTIESQTKRLTKREADKTQVNIGVIGAGNYASRVLIPAFNNSKAQIEMIACSSGISGTTVAKRMHIKAVTTDTDLLINSSDINTVVIATRHNTHAELICQALHAGKHVFVEKPLCLSLAELQQIESSIKANPDALLMVGFNRRFAPQIQKMKSLLAAKCGPKSFIMTINAGAIKASHWTQDVNIGGGRLIGEACHFIDLLRYLAESPITDAGVVGLTHVGIKKDTFSISLSFADGSFGVIHYFANGHNSFPKERLEVFADNSILQLDNFRSLKGFGWPRFKQMKLWRQDKGQIACVNQFVDAILAGEPSPIPLADIIEVARYTIVIDGELRQSQ